jgi:hypothetical protein
MNLPSGEPRPLMRVFDDTAADEKLAKTGLEETLTRRFE